MAKQKSWFDMNTADIKKLTRDEMVTAMAAVDTLYRQAVRIMMRSPILLHDQAQRTNYGGPNLLYEKALECVKRMTGAQMQKCVDEDQNSTP